MKTTGSNYLRRNDPLDQKGIEQLHKQALEQLNAVEADDCFTLEDLFVGYDWKKLQPSDRKSFGRFFSFYIREKGKKIAVITGMTAQNQTLYRKLG